MKGLIIAAAAAAAALALVPFKSKTNETKDETEYRSLLYKYTIKKTENEDGTINKRFDANFAGLPSQSEFTEMKENVSGAIQNGVNFVKKKFTKGDEGECCCHQNGDEGECCCHRNEDEGECCHDSEETEPHEGCCCHKHREEAPEDTGEEKAE